MCALDMWNVCLKTQRNNRICWKVAYFFLRKMQILWVKKLRTLRIIKIIWAQLYREIFQIYISVPLNLSLEWLILSFELPSSKYSVSNDTLISIPKQPVHVYCSELTIIMNDSLKNKRFLCILRNTQITSCHKKDNKGNKENYRSVSILSNFSQVF